MIDAEVLSAALGGRPKPGGGFMACCPAHIDNNPSLSIDQGDNGNVVFRCFSGCPQPDIIDALKAKGLWSSEQGQPATRQELEAAMERTRKRETERQTKRDKAAAKAKKIWQASTTALADNLYLVKKQVKPVDTLREIPLARLVEIAGYHPQANGVPLKDGRILVVPVKVGDRLATCEFIDGDGRKTALADGQKSGGYWAAQQLPSGDGQGLRLLLGEGAATVLSAKEATGYHVVAALTCGNLLNVARMLRERYPAACLVVLADLGNGQSKAEEAAKAVGGLLAVPDFGPERPPGATDVNDQAAHLGLESVKNCIEAAIVPDGSAGVSPTPSVTVKGPEPLPDELLSVAAFDFALLPDSLRDWAQDICERVQCPPDFVAAGIMTSLAAVIGRKIGIRPQAKTDWTVTPNLWALVVGRPGVLKSPALEAALAPLKRLVAQATEKHSGAFAEYKKNQAVAKLRTEAKEKAAREQLKKNTDADVLALLAVEEPDVPSLRRYIANDTSPASLGELLRQNPNGLLAYRDELVSLLKGLDREDQAEGRGFYLTAWNGDSPYTFDRIGRGLNLHIEAVCLSVLGGTQPGRLAEYIRHAVKGGAADDGLIQRFGLLVWPDTGGTWKDVDRWPDNDAKNQAFKVFDYLDKLDPDTIGTHQDTDLDGNSDGSPYLRFDTGGLALFLEWRTDLEKRLRGGDLHPALESHFAKYRKLIPALALIIHLADGGSGPVTEKATLQALAWGDYLETHARRAYGAISQPEVAAAKAILGRIKKGNLPASFSSRHVWRPGWAMLSDREQVAEALRLLVEYGHLKETRMDETGGRPATIYHTIEGGQE